MTAHVDKCHKYDYVLMLFLPALTTNSVCTQPYLLPKSNQISLKYNMKVENCCIVDYHIEYSSV